MQTSANRRGPDFLFIITDRQRADHLGAYGNPIVRTPPSTPSRAAVSAPSTVTSRRRSACRTARR